MDEINNIWWHDCELESVIELPNKDMLVLNVQYPEDWEQDVYVSKAIVFDGYFSQEVNEIPFEGNPTILGASVVSEINTPFQIGGYFNVHIKTNAGDRFVKAQSVRLLHQRFSI